MMRSDHLITRSMKAISPLQNLQIVPKDDLPVPVSAQHVFPLRLVVQWIIGIVVLFGLGTWLVWWDATVHRTFMLEDIRGACQRVMPETADRCVDTVIIQRGGGGR